MGTEVYFAKKTGARPTIYVYSLPGVAGLEGYVKVGYTERDAKTRIAEQIQTLRVGLKPKILYTAAAMKRDGSSFSDKVVHRVLRRKGIEQKTDGTTKSEWFRCGVDDVKAALLEIKEGIITTAERTASFRMRPEQEAAVEKTHDYFRKIREEEKRTPKFLWNAKMRFGKTFATYQLAKKLGAKRVLILTFKPAVQTAWEEDLATHIDFEGWQFICRPKQSGEAGIDAQYEKADKEKPIVCFGSFQDFMGVNPADKKGIKVHQEWVHSIHWDLIVFDEYHFGAWRENAKDLFRTEDDDDIEEAINEYQGNELDESWLPITAEQYLYLSGTPFKALNSGEFIEEQVYSWTYSDEQKAKQEWKGEDNPYISLPRMVMLTYQMPDDIKEVALKGEFNEFDLNLFFSAEGEGEHARFVYEEYVQKWLNLIRGEHRQTTVDELKLGAKKPPMPYSDTRLLSLLNHTLWFLPNVASCEAMANLLKARNNQFYHDYKVVVCAGKKTGNGAAALPPVQQAMGDNPLESKTITLTCGKLTTGVTVKPWTGIFMLRNLSSPETYFQSAFRVQSPWVVDGEDGTNEIVKQDCYVFDFALDRALKQIADYSCKLNVADDNNPENKVQNFINFLPVLAYDGSSMKQVSATDILDLAMAGTSATLLAKKWESALLVNVDNVTLQRLMNDEKAMKALMNIEGFRSLNNDIQTIINKSESVKKTRKEKPNLSDKEKKELSAEEKEYKSMRKKIQEKLIKFATRIPVFMYLTDFRENSLKDVITKLESDLFKKVTGLTQQDFELLVSLNVFNESLMNESVYYFRRYEDASLSYSGINKFEGKDVGLFNTTITREDYEMLAQQQQASTLGEVPEDAKSVPSRDFEKLDDAEAEPEYQSMRKAPKKTEIYPGVHKGAKVVHVTLGEGEIVKIDTKSRRIYVRFASQPSMFAVPGCFERGYLTLL
ncbi:MAG: GIY-YIG nuclease family protein [Akkermansia sp.]|nr:GIY-YIG nuclease family protein [Akkermansia sp.]